MFKSSVVLLAIALAGSGHQTKGKASSDSPAPRVFVFTAEAKSTPPTEEEQGRLDSVRDVREALGKKAGLVMVSNAEDATVLVEVTAREKRDAGIGGFGGTSVTPQGETMVRLHLKSGEHETEVKGVAPGYWGRAAKDASEKAFKWIVRITEMPGPRK
jgi:hypothetical protein